MKSLLSFGCTIRPHDPFSLLLTTDRTMVPHYLAIQYTYQYNILRYIIICSCMEKMGTIAGYYTYLSSSEVGGGFPVAF